MYDISDSGIFSIVVCVALNIVVCNICYMEYIVSVTPENGM